MLNKSFFFISLVLLIIGINLVIIGGDSQNTLNKGLSISTPQWNIEKVENGTTVYISDKKSKTPLICEVYPNAKNKNDLSSRNVYSKKDKSIKKTISQQKVDGSWADCYQVLNEKYVQIGDNSTVVTYQDYSKIDYVTDYFNTSFVLQKWNGFNYDIAPGDIWIKNQSDCQKMGKEGLCFGAIDNSSNNFTLKNYSYIINSSNQMSIEINTNENNYTYPLILNSVLINSFQKYSEVYSFKDICANNYSNCNWSIGNNSIIINFLSYMYIDPGITNISGCGNLNTSNTIYTLNQSVTSATSCFNVSGTGYNNITLDCNGFSVTRNSLGSGSGVYCGSSISVGCGYNIWNCTIINFTTSLTSFNSLIATVNPFGSNSSVTIINSNLTGTINFGAFDGTPSSGTFQGGIGGNVTAINSYLTNISTIGGKAYNSNTIGGDSGYITLINTTYFIINNYGGAGATSGYSLGSQNCNGGDANPITLINSIGKNILNYGGTVPAVSSCNSTAGNGGNIIINGSSIINGNISAYSGTGTRPNTFPFGGNLSVTNSTFNGFVSLNGTINGTFFLTNSSFSDTNQNHGRFLFIITNANGSIDFLNNVLTGKLNISTNLILNNNSAYVNSNISGLNKSANVTLYNIPTFINGQITNSSSNICNSATTPKCINFTSLNNGGTITFNVTAWKGSPYSIIEYITNSCTYSGIGNWIINMADYCNLTSNVQMNGNITFYNSGAFNVSNYYLNFSSPRGYINFNTTGQKLIVGSNNKFLRHV